MEVFILERNLVQIGAAPFLDISQVEVEACLVIAPAPSMMR